MADKPNIVYILNDHQPYYRHGWDGGPKIQRPHFDRLAQAGVTFARSYTACPLCGPARRTMLTGLFPHNHREIKNNSDHPYDREVYLDLLAEAGYRNYYFGKWHAGPGTAYDHSCEGFSYPSYNNPYTKPEYKRYLEKHGLPDPEILIERSFWPKVMPNGSPITMRAGEPYRQERPWCNEHASGVMTTPNDTHEAFFLAHTAVEKLQELEQSRVKAVLPGHGAPAGDPVAVIGLTRRYLKVMREIMGQAVEDWTPFDEAYEAADWSEFIELPAFTEANRSNAYGVYLSMQKELLEEVVAEKAATIQT